ncbi:MAG TPA: Hint domain-containing protein [Dongiaceae bacterium]|nr:Hint domain-containing protein [Dongiaceae bacterium]
MTANIVYKYPLDLTGQSPNNLIVGEVHNLALNPNRAFVCNYGPFYAKSVVIVDQSTGKNLVPHVDYLCLQLYKDASEASGLEVDGIILVINPAIGNTVQLTCQVVGGQYSDNAYALQQMINQLSLDDQVVQWGQIIGTPSEFPPAPHLHSVDDVYGWEYLASAIDDLRQAILTGNQPAIDAIRQTLMSQFQLYQLKLGYVPVKQAATLGNDAGQISLFSDGNGNIMGSLDGVTLGQVLFSSSQINTTLANLVSEVAALSGSVTWGSTNISPTDGLTGSNNEPTLVGDTYYPQYGVPQQARQFQIITANGDFSSPLRNTSLSPATTGAGNTVTEWAVGTALPSNVSFAWRYRDLTIKNQYSVWSTPTYFTTSLYSVNAPTITSPTNGTTGSGPSPTITLSAFSTSGGSDTLQSTSVRILNSSGTVVWEQDNSTTQLNNIVIPAGILKPNSTYTIQARYFGTAYGASVWSNPISITTAAAYITVPTITSPMNNQLLTTMQPTVTISAFSTAVGTDTLASTSIRVLNSAGIVAWEQDNSTTQLNNITIPAGVLNAGGYTYTIQVGYTGVKYGFSGWSTPITVKTATFVNTQVTTSAQTTTSWTSSFNTTSSWITSATVNKQTTVSRATTTSWTTSASKITTWQSTNPAASHTTSQVTSRISSWTTTWPTAVPMSRTTTRVSSYTTTWQTGLAKSRTTTRTSSYSTVWATSAPASRNTTTSWSTLYMVCVAEGTPITLANGATSPVEALYEGQELKSNSLPGLMQETARADDYVYYQTDSIEAMGQVTTKVAAIKKETVPQLYAITMAGDPDPLKVTPEHPLFIRDVNGVYRFISAEQLSLDDTLVTEGGKDVAIEHVELLEGEFTIYKVDCSPYDLFVHQGVIGHNMKVGGNTYTYETTSVATLTSWTSTWNTSQITTATVSYTTSWTSYFNTSQVTSATVSYTTSWTSSRNTSQTTSAVVNYTTAWTTTYASTATLSRSTTTSWTTSQQTLTTWTTTVTKTTSWTTSVQKLTSTHLSRTTTTSWLTEAQTAT